MSPEWALVLRVDEKSRIQALDRSRPARPGYPGRAGRDDVRAGTTTLFAAFDAATGTVTGPLHRRHWAEEFRKFPAERDKEVPAGLDVHLILDTHDNDVTHEAPAVKQWLLVHPRFHLRVTPTRSSWLNLVERWFAELTQNKPEQGDHRSVQALERDIRSRPAAWNEHAGPFVRTRAVDEILDRAAAYCRRTPDSGHEDRAAASQPITRSTTPKSSRAMSATAAWSAGVSRTPAASRAQCSRTRCTSAGASVRPGPGAGPGTARGSGGVPRPSSPTGPSPLPPESRPQPGG
ncbi:transposase [Streptomyces sp. NPDC090029]|uniref:transposase n=1 Tax=Streptomyces sp. NPDC090029 TaxID=3365924 RepID=UPI0038269BAF